MTRPTTSPSTNPGPNPWDLLSETERTAFRNGLSRAEQVLGEARDAFEGQTDERLLEQPLAASLPRARQNLVLAFEQLSNLMEFTSAASMRWLDQLSQENSALVVVSQSDPAIDLTETHP
jgi:hypothetical protein